MEKFNADQTKGRIPVLAFGSNKAPAQLQRKFGAEDVLIPVEKVYLKDFDVVFSAHITSYGAIPAMLQHCPDVTVEIALTWLNEAQLEVMHKSELYAANYSYAQLNDISLTREDQSIMTSAFGYIGERGHYSSSRDDQRATAIKDVYAHNRQWPEKTTADMISHLFQLFGHQGTEEDFILECIKDIGYRRNLTKKISEYENSFAYAYEIISEG